MKMINKIRSFFILILALIFIAAVIGLAATNARYVSSPSPTTNSEYTGEIEYSVGDVVVVKTVAELISAIESGYSNIQIDESLPNPFSVYANEMTVENDLILDLNGHEIQRNSREPMLKVAAGVKLTIIDSAGGGFTL